MNFEVLSKKLSVVPYYFASNRDNNKMCNMIPFQTHASFIFAKMNDDVNKHCLQHSRRMLAVILVCHCAVHLAICTCSEMKFYLVTRCADQT